VVEHDEVAVRLEPGAPQVVGAGQSGLTGAYDGHLDLTRFVHASTNGGTGVDLP
jgi:hypothetical protein